jgi:hypothetical protein
MRLEIIPEQLGPEASFKNRNEALKKIPGGIIPQLERAGAIFSS